MRSLLLTSLLFAAACGGDDGGTNGKDASSDVDAVASDAILSNGDASDGNPKDASSGPCNLQAAISASAVMSTVTGVGTLDCDASHLLTVKVCVQWKLSAAGEFQDIKCESQSMTGTNLELENVSACGVSETAVYRTLVTGAYDSQDLSAVTSDEISCP